MPNQFTLATWNDAGELREYVAARYGSALKHGCRPDTHRRAISACRRLGRLTGRTVEQVIEQAMVDYDLSDLTA